MLWGPPPHLDWAPVAAAWRHPATCLPAADMSHLHQPCPHIMSTQTNPHTFAFVRILFSLHNVNYFWYTLYLRYHSFIVSFSKWSMKRSQRYFQIYAFFLFLSLMFFNFSSFSFIFRCFSIIFSSSYLNIARTALVNWEFDVLQLTFYVHIMRYDYLHTK